jgi:hypothetical protein
MTDHNTGTRQEWLAARLDLLKDDEELTRRSDELARQRGGDTLRSFARTRESRGSPGSFVVQPRLFCRRENMSESLSGGGAIRYEGGNVAPLAAADWLCLAATPTFAIMALLTAVLSSRLPDMLCSAANDASPLSGMGPMYMLMSALHSAPWLKLISGRRSGA